MWDCPDCGKADIEDSAAKCPGCGFMRRVFPVLSGATGEMTLRTSLVFGYKNLTQLVGAAEARYAASRQFELRLEGECWAIRAFPGTRNATTLNGAELTEDWVAIQDGAVIHIASRRDAAVKVAEIRVSLLN